MASNGAQERRSDQPAVDCDVEDLVPDNWFIRLVHCVAWLLTLALSILSTCFIVYQLYALYVPYCRAKLTGDATYRFPDYFYRVWGNDATDLTSEHWGYLGACAAVTLISAVYVVPCHPFESKASFHSKADDELRSRGLRCSAGLGHQRPLPPASDLRASAQRVIDHCTRAGS
eukprot:CAMPEP_0197892928 /NCGR_PEP_ID=MMETSP1439-20131203/32086_1 /TAXON_ID=66791 /ORGANISM="Gonyaulax spinifera, Strain CCMP409" /LENGTH=172 /DNA_ID=CAMNT_0043513149 /DNA_START=48 /DNA_END=564 /DNA_ORIENTATION=+